MTIASGTRLGPYEVESPLGAGGSGLARVGAGGSGLALGTASLGRARPTSESTCPAPLVMTRPTLPGPSQPPGRQGPHPARRLWRFPAP